MFFLNAIPGKQEINRQCGYRVPYVSKRLAQCLCVESNSRKRKKGVRNFENLEKSVDAQTLDDVHVCI